MQFFFIIFTFRDWKCAGITETESSLVCVISPKDSEYSISPDGGGYLKQEEVFCENKVFYIAKEY